MNTLTQLWLNSLAGHLDDACVQQLAHISEAQAAQLIALAQQQSLTALFYWRIRPFARQLPSVLTEPLRRRFLLSTARSLQREQELARILNVLNAVEIQPTLFKGGALAHTIYPTSELRSMTDLDLWIEPSKMDTAIRALGQIGYNWREKPTRPHAWQLEREGEIQLFGGGRHQGLVELHYGVFAGEWLYRTTHVDVAGIVERRRSVRIAGQAAWVLAPEDALIQVAVHLAVNHSMSDMALRSLMDILFLSPQIENWEQVITRAKQWRIATLVGLVLQFADDLLGIPDLKPVLDGLGLGALRRRMLGRLIDRNTIISAQGLARSPSRFLFLLLLVDRPVDMFRLIYRSFFPERAWLERRYGEFTWNTRWQHLARALSGHF